MANPLQAAINNHYMEDLLGNKLGPLKPALSHIGLYLSIVAYTAVGAGVSQFFYGFLAQHSFSIITQPYIILCNDIK